MFPNFKVISNISINEMNVICILNYVGAYSFKKKHSQVIVLICRVLGKIPLAGRHTIEKSFSWNLGILASSTKKSK